VSMRICFFEGNERICLFAIVFVFVRTYEEIPSMALSKNLIPH
jgi:hypothetical protein